MDFCGKRNPLGRLTAAAVLLQPVGELHGKIDAFADLSGGFRAAAIGAPHLVERIQQTFEVVRQRLLAEGGILARARSSSLTNLLMTGAFQRLTGA